MQRKNNSGCANAYAGRHAVTGIGAADFCYDQNGNETSGHNFATSSDRATTWTPFKKPATITDGTNSVSFDYGADRARFRQVNGTTGVTTLYVDGIFEREIVGGVKTDIHYILAGGEAVAIYKSHEDSSEETLYLHKDHLGSVVEITDEAGVVVESLSYDAFGKRRDAADWDGAGLTPADTARGYTGHEHLDDLGLVHMNGRVFDPEIGRMISADPTVQFPGYSQSFNRYSYVLNNPLRYTDPSGYCIAAGPSCPTSGLGGFSGGGLGAGGQGAPGISAVVSVGYMLVPVVGRIYTATASLNPGSNHPGVTNNPWGAPVQTCSMTDWLCGGIQWNQGQQGFGRNYYDHSLYSQMFGSLAVSHSYGIIGYALHPIVQVEYFYQEWLAYLESGFANNATTGTGTHARIAENDSGAGGNPVTAAPGNPNTGPGLGSAMLDLAQAGIGVLGMIPWIGNLADGANAGISGLRGDYLGAAMDGASAIPLVGGVTGAANIARRTVSAATGIYNAGKRTVGAASRAVGAASAAIGGLFRRAEGVVYRRVDRTGGLAPYYGQSKNEGRYIARQSEHARAHPDADFEFEIVGRASPGEALDVLEHRTIQAATGGIAARYSSRVSNRVDPVGAARRGRLGLPEPQFQE